jgi:hypothetical protein
LRETASFAEERMVTLLQRKIDSLLSVGYEMGAALESEVVGMDEGDASDTMHMLVMFLDTTFQQTLRSVRHTHTLPASSPPLLI